MTPEYVDASDLIQPDTRSDAQKWLDAEMDKRWANEQGVRQFLILEAIALKVIEENRRLRAQIGQGEPVAFMSSKQLPALKDPDDEGGKYMPLRKTKLGNFDLPLYAHPAPQQRPLLFSEIWDNDAIMEVNADARLPFEMIERFVRAVEAAHNIGEKK